MTLYQQLILYRFESNVVEQLRTMNLLRAVLACFNFILEFRGYVQIAPECLSDRLPLYELTRWKISYLIPSWLQGRLRRKGNSVRELATREQVMFPRFCLPSCHICSPPFCTSSARNTKSACNSLCIVHPPHPVAKQVGLAAAKPFGTCFESLIVHEESWSWLSVTFHFESLSYREKDTAASSHISPDSFIVYLIQHCEHTEKLTSKLITRPHRLARCSRWQTYSSNVLQFDADRCKV
jgi:hypothetical protein